MICLFIETRRIFGFDVEHNQELQDMKKYKKNSICHLSFTGWTGHVTIDDNGEREPDYWLWSLSPEEDQFTNCAFIRDSENLYQVSFINR